RDQGLVVRDGLVRARRVVHDLQLDLPAEDAPVRVHVRRPELVALPQRLARIGEVAARGQRYADHYRLLRLRRALAHVGRRCEAGERQGREESLRPLRHLMLLLSQTSRQRCDYARRMSESGPIVRRKTYELVAERLLTDMGGRRLKPGDALPTEREL